MQAQGIRSNRYPNTNANILKNTARILTQNVFATQHQSLLREGVATEAWEDELLFGLVNIKVSDLVGSGFELHLLEAVSSLLLWQLFSVLQKNFELCKVYLRVVVLAHAVDEACKVFWLKHIFIAKRIHESSQICRCYIAFLRAIYQLKNTEELVFANAAMILEGLKRSLFIIEVLE